MTELLGFSTGAIYKSGLSINQRISFIQSLGCKAIELGYVLSERLIKEPFKNLDLSLLKSFDWVSLHAPGSLYKYNQNPDAKTIFEQIENLHRQFPLGAVVFHPDSFEDFSILDGYAFPVAIENMDFRKAAFQKSDTLLPLFSAKPEWKLILDVNHLYTNDDTMGLLDEFKDKLGKKIAEVHLSGFEKLHEPLFKTRQIEIVKAAKFGVPIIIESTLDTLDDARTELEYVKNNL